jgi:uncharacterized protein (TIGR00255 family)
MMNLVSMTGRGIGRADGPIGRAEAELSSVNRKQLDVNLALPHELAFAEADVVRLVQQRVVRGRIGGEIRFARAADAAAGLKVDLPAARAYAETLRGAARDLGLRDDLGVSLLAEWPRVLVFELPESDRQALLGLALRALGAALDSLDAMRRREGDALGADLRERFATLRALCGEIGERAPLVPQLYRERLAARIAEILPAGSDWREDERLLKEVAIFADRADITEERVRLASHLDQAAALLEAGGTVGRKLDFIVQEMGREINTIGSKANDGEISRRVIDFKAELERVREQIQNLE